MHEDYDDNEYDEDYYDYDHPSLNPYHYYFKFDVSAGSPLSKWLTDMLKDIDWNQIPSVPLNNIAGFPFVSLPVNSWFSNTGKSNSFQYLGTNYHGVPIWKSKYFLHDKINTEYKLHIQQYAKYFVSQPNYYKGLFDILN